MRNLPDPGNVMPDLVLLNEVNATARSLALDDIGNFYSCWRLRSEDDTRFSFRLAVHIQEKIIEQEQHLAHVLSLSRHPTSNPGETA
jgi:hypothetical protein